MYGYTPPTIIAVDPDLLCDVAGFQTVAAGIATELAKRPAWILVKAPEALAESPRPNLAIEACLRVPDEELPDDANDAVAEVLRRHLEDVGVVLDIHSIPSGPTPHSPASAIVAGTWHDAVVIAKMAGAPHIIGWTLEPAWVPDEVGGMPFVPARPDAVAF